VSAPKREALLEAFLARIYTDPQALDRFLSDPRGEAVRAGLDREVAEAAAGMNRADLQLAAHSFARKRARAAPRSLLQRVRAAFK